MITCRADGKRCGTKTAVRYNVRSSVNTGNGFDDILNERRFSLGFREAEVG